LVALHLKEAQVTTLQEDNRENPTQQNACEQKQQGREEAACLELLGEHELIIIRKIKFVMARGMRRIKFEQFAEAAGDHPDSRSWKKREKLLLVFNVGYSREPAVEHLEMGCNI
jgi:hypothetical protein